jgi:FkbM family methyltransferase
VNAALRWVAALRPARAVLKSRRVEPLVAAMLRASPARARVRFLAREARSPSGPRVYRLREPDAIVYVRHGTPDVAALGEVFYERQYEPPPGVAAVLEGLDRPLEILDLGANVGYFSVFAAFRFPGSRIVAFEPDPANAELMRRTIEANNLDCELVEAAASTRDGEVPFAGGGYTLSRIDPGGEPVPARDVLPQLSEFDLAKIDIEGGEWELLSDSRFPSSTSRALALEFHTHLAPPDADAQSVLEAAGYSIERRLQFGERHGLLWALRG